METEVYKLLESLSIPYFKYSHPAVYTIDEAKAYWTDESGRHCKNLFFRNHKGDKHYLVILHYAKTLDVKSLSKKIESRPMSFASEERLKKYLGLTPGAVSPFGLINDTNKEVIVIIDNDLQKEEKISFHPNINTASITISFSDFIKYLDWTQNEYRFMDI